MAAMLGADTARLRAVAALADTTADALRAVGARVAAEVEAVDWIGPDADAFRADVDAIVRADLDTLAELLDDDADELRRQADEQDAASAARGGGAAGGTSPSDAPPASARLDPATIGALERAAGDPGAVAALLRDVPHRELERLAVERPELVGPLAGAPYWARDLANRELLARALSSGDGSAAFRRDLEAIDRVLASTPDASLAELDLGDPDRVFAAVALGDLDAASNVSYLVPGINNRASSRLAQLTESAMNVRDEVALAGSGDLADVATVAWLGYESGNIATVPFDGLAERGADRLESSLDAFTAVRPDAGVDLGVVAHSYGATTTGLALSDGSQHGVDRFVAVGPAGFVHARDTNGWWPGGREITPADFGSTQVWTTEAGADRIADLGRIASGRLDPADHGFATFSSDADTASGRPGTTGHDLGNVGVGVGYLGPGSNSLYGIGRILNGLE